MMELLKGAYDLHVHCAPDVVRRKVTDIELAQRYIAAGFKGFTIKSHQLCTAGRAALVREVYPACNAIGSVTLNNAMGGFNAMAVEMAARMGARIVWFPTVDSKNQDEFLHRNKDVAAPYGAVADNAVLKRKFLGIFDETGALKEEVYNVIDVIKAHKLVLATGHISPTESYALIKAAAKRGVERLVVTHPDFPCTAMPVEQQKELIADCGAIIEHNYCQIYSKETTFAAAIAQIKAVGPENCIVCSDGGQSDNIYPDEACELYANELLKAGLTEEQVRTIFVKNTAKLVEL